MYGDAGRAAANFGAPKRSFLIEDVDLVNSKLHEFSNVRTTVKEGTLDVRGVARRNTYPPLDGGRRWLPGSQVRMSGAAEVGRASGMRQLMRPHVPT
jgi:hypothetical protein